MDEYAHPQHSSVRSVLIVILLLVTSLFSIAAYSPTGLIAVPPVAADDAAVTNSTALTTTTIPFQPANSSTTGYSISTPDNSAQSAAVSNSTSTLDNSTISSRTSTSNSSTTSNSTTVNETVISTQTSTTTSSASTNSSSSGAIISNTIATIVTSAKSVNSTTLTNSATTVVITSTNTTIANTTISETTSTSHVQSSFRVDRWDWSTWNPMNGLAIWITNTGVEPLYTSSLSASIGGVPAEFSLYPGPPQACPLDPIFPQNECRLILAPNINPVAGNSYTVVVTASDGVQAFFGATYGSRSDNPGQFTVNDVNWESTCCNYVLSLQIMNTGGTALDTDQMAALMTLNGQSVELRSACGVIAPGTQCRVTFRVSTLTSYLIVVTDPRTGDHLYLITLG